jgi:CheY-like chemotaxis protein
MYAKRSDGEHALALFASGRPTARSTSPFIDIGLPGGMDGYELARRIRSHPKGRDVRLVALTGYGSPKIGSSPSRPGSHATS